MAELDFSKIFGETATSKASFTDENYIKGWGYLGSTPPPYQLFDYLQSLNDKKSKYLYDSINENKNNLLAHNTDTSAHTAEFSAHNTDEQAHSGLFQKVKTELATHNTDSSAHTPILNAHNADVNAHNPITEMIGKILGATNWQENPVATLKDIKNTLGMGGIVAQKLETNGFVKFANGLTMQWGVIEKYDELNQGGADFKSDQASKLFNIAFTTKALALVVSDMGYYKNNILYTGSTDVTGNVRGRIMDNSSFKVGLDYNVVGSHIVDIQWFAIGF